jgi:hypothetical protein
MSADEYLSIQLIIKADTAEHAVDAIDDWLGSSVHHQSTALGYDEVMSEIHVKPEHIERFESALDE